MPDMEGMRFAWRPEMGDGSPTVHETAAMQKALNRLYSAQAVQGKEAAAIPLNVWIGDREVFVAAEIPTEDPREIEVRLDGQTLSIHAGHPSRERAVTLPFPPDPATVKTRYVDGILFIEMDRPPA